MNFTGIAKIAVISALVLLAVMVSKDRIYGGMCLCFLAYVALREYRTSKKADSQLKYLTELDRFCQNLKHVFFRTGSIRDAVFLGSGRVKQPLKKELEDIYGILESPDAGTLGSVYQNSDKDKYLRLLMSLFLLVEENGDSNTDEGSVFMNAVMQLRMEARDERRAISARRHKFMGLSLTAALPCASVLLIASWGAGVNPNLLTFYYGRTGTVFRIVILMISLICYRIVSGLKNPDIPQKEGIYLVVKGKRTDILENIGLNLRRTILFSFFGIVMLLSLLEAHHETVRLLKTDHSNINMLCDVADGRQIAAMEYLIPAYTQIYTEDSADHPAKDELAEILLEEDGIRTLEVASASAEEIIRRVEAIDDEKPDPIDLIIVIAAGLAGFFYPDLEVFFETLMRRSRIKDEIMQFQTIISMQKDVPGMSPILIMESLESFSDYFRPSLKTCLNDIGTNEEEALLRLKMSCTDPDFERIADCFMMADELGVTDAFDEISSEIRAFREDRRSERTIRIDNDVLLASLTAVIPGGLILFGYLLVPFMVSALNMFNSYQNSLKDYISIS